MKWLITISILIACSHRSAHFYTKFAAELKAAIPSKHAIEKVIEKYQAKGSGAKFLSGIYDDRVNFLELKCHEYWIRLDEDSILKHHSDNNSKLNLYFSNDLVVHINLEGDSKTLLTYTDTALLDKHISRANNLYGVSFERSKFLNGFISYYHEYDIFGIEWGLKLATAPKVYEPMENIFKLVYTSNLDALILLAKSSCNETKAYAAAGLFLLKKEEYDIHTEGKQLLEEIKVSKAPINFAAGGCEIECGTETSYVLTNYFLMDIRRRYLSFKSSQKNLPPVCF